MVAFMIEQAHKLLVLPKKRQTARFPSCVNGLQLGVKGNSDLLLITSLKVFVIDILFVSGMNTLVAQ